MWYYCKCSMYSVIDHKGFCCVGTFFLLLPPPPQILKDPSEFVPHWKLPYVLENASVETLFKQRAFL